MSPRPVLLTQEQREQLARNGQLADRNPNLDPVPVVKLFTPDAGATWLLAWTDTEDPDIAFGLCDLGLGVPELGTVRISELAEVRGRLGLPVERDRHWMGQHPISVYAKKAWAAERIVS